MPQGPGVHVQEPASVLKVVPVWEDGIIPWANVWQRGQTGVGEAAGLVNSDKIKMSIRSRVYTVIAVPIQLEGEW